MTKSTGNNNCMEGIDSVFVDDENDCEGNPEPPPWSPVVNEDEECDLEDEFDYYNDSECDEEAIIADIQQDAVTSCVTTASTLQNESELSVGSQKWTGFKIVGDNVDKDIRPSFQRIDYRTRSLHYFHAYAMLDRVD